jgi:hypothetical protein
LNILHNRLKERTSIMKKFFIMFIVLLNVSISFPALAGTFTDSATGLTWDETTAGPMTWQAALEYCETRSLGGYSDWRMPDINELQSIVDYSLYDPASSRPGTISGFYWSATTQASSIGSAWGINFNDGDITTYAKTGTYYVRPVRGGSHSPLCVVDDGNGNGTVTDPETGLLWEQETAGPMTWQEALAYCENLSLAGHTDWRLPDIDELQSIVEYTAYNPAITNPECSKYGPFPGTASGFYWSSTTQASSIGNVWGVNFQDGDITTYAKTGSYYVRAVRGGEYHPLCVVDNGSGDGTASDTASGLTWARETAGPFTWQEALAHCKTFEATGFTDWHMPDINELQSLVEYGAYDPAVTDPECSKYGPFEDTVSDFYWSSTSQASSIGNAWGVNFKDGDITTYAKTGTYYVRPVRNAKPQYMTVSIGPTASGEAPFSFDLSANTHGILMDYYEWYITGGTEPDAVTMDGYISPTLFTEGEYTIRIVAYDVYGRKYEAELLVKVLAPSTISQSVRFIPHYPSSDSTASTVMKGGHAVRYYRIVTTQNVPITNKAFYYKYPDGTRFTTAIDDQGFVEIRTPRVLANQTLRIIVTNKDGAALGGIDILDAPEFPVQITNREFSEQYKLLIGMGATVGKSGPKFTLGPVKFKTVEAGLHGEKNVSTTITLSTSGSTTDMDMENTLDMELGVETFAGISASILKEYPVDKRPKLEAGGGENAYVGTAMSTVHRFEDFFNRNKPDHNDQLLVAAALFFENLLKLDPMFLNNVLTHVLLEKLMEDITGEYYQETGLSGSLKVQADLGGEFSLKNPLGIFAGSGAGIDMKAFDGETVLTLSGGKDVDGTKSMELSVETDIDVGTFSTGLSQKFGGDKRRKNTPKLKMDWIDVAWKRFEGEMSLGAEIDPNNRWSLIFSILTNRAGGNSYFLNSYFSENFFNMTVKDETVIDFMERESDLIAQVRSGDGFEISEVAYLSAVQAFEALSFGRVEWNETTKDIRLTSIPIDIGLGFGLSLELSFNVDVKSVVEYLKTKGVFIPEKGMVKTAIYERDAEIDDHIKGFTAVTDEYVAIIEGVLDSVLETLEKIKEAGKELLVETGNAIAAGGAKIKAGATSLASGAKLKLTQLLGWEKRSFRIYAATRSGESAAATVGGIFVVSVTDEAGNLIEFIEPLELTVGYTDADLTAAGFTLTDASRLSLYRWNSTTGYYDYIGGTVDTDVHSVTSMIPEPGQYILAIDGAGPDISGFTATPGTLTPEISLTLLDTLSGINPSSVSVKLDGVEVINGYNISEYLNFQNGVFRWIVPQSLTKGQHTLAIHAEDTAGNAADKTFTFTVNDVPPTIAHMPITQASAGTPLALTAGVTDDEGIQAVLLGYRARTSELPYTITPMLVFPTRNSQYVGTIPITHLTSFGTRYFIRAMDLSGNVTETEPADITVLDNVGPIIPGNPVAAPSVEGFNLSWPAALDADTAGYRVYLGMSADALILFENTGMMTWIALDNTHGDALIAVAAYDSAGNEGPKTDAVKVSQCIMADIDCNGKVDLADAILCLELLSGKPADGISLSADVNKDLKIGEEEAIYILRTTAEVK